MFKIHSNITGVFCFLILFFCVLGCRSVVGGYSVRDGKVYYNNGFGGFALFGGDDLVGGADAETFEIINNQYAKDKYRAYFEGKKITKSDVNTYELIKYVYSKDKSNVYYRRSVLTDKPQTFKILFLDRRTPNFIAFSTDGTKIYSEGKPFLPDKVDLSTFERVGKTGYARDKNHIYNSRKEIDADPETFEVINHSSFGNTYARDRSSVFYSGSKVEKADVKTHEIIDDRYHKDANHVFERTRTVSDDPQNFQVPKPN